MIYRPKSKIWGGRSSILSLAQLEWRTKLILQLLWGRYYPTLSVVILTLKAAWSFLREFVAEELEPNTFLFRFSKQEDQEQVLAFNPWNIQGNIMVLKSWIYELTILEVDFHSKAFWIQVHGFPWNRINEKAIQFLGLKLGKLLEIDKWEHRDQDRRPFFRIRVDFDLKKPLVGGFPIPCKHFQLLWVQFQYEKLADFCYGCKMIGHI